MHPRRLTAKFIAVLLPYKQNFRPEIDGSGL